eukprot:129689-Pyramimonas_sp.AAC.1
MEAAVGVQRLPVELLDESRLPVALAEEVLQEIWNGVGLPFCAQRLPHGTFVGNALDARTTAGGRL